MDNLNNIISNIDPQSRTTESIIDSAVAQIKTKKLVFVKLLTVLFALIVIFPYFYDNCLFSTSGIKKLEKLTNKSFSPSFLLAIYLMGKTVGFLFLISVFVWFARIYDNLRRLEMIFNLDKNVIYQILTVLNRDADIDISPYIDKLLEPALHQAEKTKEDANNHLSEAIAKLIDKVADKLSSK
jgi:hypothetical protein